MVDYEALLRWAPAIVDTRNAIRSRLGTIPENLAKKLWFA